MEVRATSRAVLLFARPAQIEARIKHLVGAEFLFTAIANQIERSTSLVGATLITLGPRAQRGSTFGERLQDALSQVAARGFTEIVAVGADTPGIDAGHLAAAFEAIERQGAALGPAPDGGVYLLGLKADRLGALRGVRWQTSATFSDLLARLPAAVLEPLADLDSPRTLRRLARCASPLLRRLRLLFSVSFLSPLPAITAKVVRVQRARGPPLPA